MLRKKYVVVPLFIPKARMGFVDRLPATAPYRIVLVKADMADISTAFAWVKDFDWLNVSPQYEVLGRV